MKLTIQEQEMLDGKYGDSVQKAMELLVAVGDCYDAEKMVPITSVHLNAGSPVSAGKGGTRFIMDMAERGGKFVIPVTINVASIDPWAWKEMGFSEENYREQEALSEVTSKMGGFNCHTCTPYQIGHIPRMREHVAWCESSAVLYANAVLGGRANREGAPGALAAGLTGRVPAYGYHLDENRYGRLKIVVHGHLKGDTDYAILGYFAGKIAQDRVPIFTGIPSSISSHELKCLGAALAASGSVAHYHVVGATPEAPNEEVASGFKTIGSSDTFEFGVAEFKETEESISNVGPEEADLVILGCPHPSIEQIRNYAKALSGRKVKNNVELWILTSHIIKRYAEDIGLTNIIESTGARFVSDTCPNPMPRDYFKKRGYRVAATDSPKLAYYISNLKNMPCYCGSLDKFIDIVTSKR